MMSEAEIETLLTLWRQAAKNLRGRDDDIDWSDGLAHGYVGALEMVLYG